jgi:hypothetical protein
LKTSKEGVGICSIVHNTLKVEKHIGVSGWGLGRMISEAIIHKDLHKPNNKSI